MFNNIVKIKEFTDSFQISTYRLIDSTLSFNPGSNYSSDPDNILRISRSRSFSLLRDYIKSNHFEYFVTMTLKDSIRYDIFSAIKLFNDSISVYKKYSSRKLAKQSLSPAGAESLESVKIMRDFLPALRIQTPQDSEAVEEREPLRPSRGALPPFSVTLVLAKSLMIFVLLSRLYLIRI